MRTESEEEGELVLRPLPSASLDRRAFASRCLGTLDMRTWQREEEREPFEKWGREGGEAEREEEKKEEVQEEQEERRSRRRGERILGAVLTVGRVTARGYANATLCSCTASAGQRLPPPSCAPVQCPT